MSPQVVRTPHAEALIRAWEEVEYEEFREIASEVEVFRAAKEAWIREGEKTVPWEEIKADLGLDKES